MYKHDASRSLEGSLVLVGIIGVTELCSYHIANLSIGYE